MKLYQVVWLCHVPEKCEKRCVTRSVLQPVGVKDFHKTLFLFLKLLSNVDDGQTNVFQCGKKTYVQFWKLCLFYLLFFPRKLKKKVERRLSIYKSTFHN